MRLVIGCLLSAQLTDRLGVLRVIQLGTPINLLAWPLMTLTSGMTTMVAGSILLGVFVGLNAFGGRLYIAEVSSVHRRATLCYLPTTAVGVALLACFSLSAAIPWRYAALLCGCVPSVLHFFGATLLPNSPRWLLHHGAAEEQARKSIAFYRGPQADISSELRDIRLSLKGGKNLNILRQAKLLFTDWSVARPCLLLLMQYVFDVFCGGLVLAQYAPGIFQSVVASLSAAQCSQLLAALQVCGLICSATLLRWWGRRIVLMTAGALACTGMLIVAAFYYFEDSLSEYSWLVLLGVVLANAASSGGVSPISHVICGELLPLSIRPLFGNVLSLYLGGMSLTFLNIFPLLRSALGSHGLFAALAGVNVLLMLYAAFLLPETRGLSLEQVQMRHFSSKKKTAAVEANGAAVAAEEGKAVVGEAGEAKVAETAGDAAAMEAEETAVAAKAGEAAETENEVPALSTEEREVSTAAATEPGLEAKAEPADGERAARASIRDRGGETDNIVGTGRFGGREMRREEDGTERDGKGRKD
ncbi:sugar transporter ERD6-like 6 [Amphibalanus amphitrite]|uniref:sugar transporter ERD6-like 6 n=1 Tax=Amphibalanus amphitrite TaxID=1232801 RepID=UPI001C9241A0|nr:sugar transporter ERD6-like 6 [Amphibalanus amphitrite]